MQKTVEESFDDRGPRYRVRVASDDMGKVIGRNGSVAKARARRAAGLAVTVAVLLASRSRLHRFVRSVLTEYEEHRLRAKVQSGEVSTRAMTSTPYSWARSIAPANGSKAPLWTSPACAQTIAGPSVSASRSASARIARLARGSLDELGQRVGDHH